MGSFYRCIRRASHMGRDDAAMRYGDVIADGHELRIVGLELDVETHIDVGSNSNAHQPVRGRMRPDVKGHKLASFAQMNRRKNNLNAIDGLDGCGFGRFLGAAQDRAPLGLPWMRSCA